MAKGTSSRQNCIHPESLKVRETSTSSVGTVRGGIEQGFGPIGDGNLAVGQGGPELAVSYANLSNA